MGHGVGDCDRTGRPWHLAEWQHQTNWVVWESIRFLEDRDPSCPFFLLASFDAPRCAAEQAPIAEQPLVEPLSERELEVLELLSEGCSNREIGQRLYISLPTVKSHTRNIYSKLGVHSRREAVARARALGMLPSS